MKSTALALLLLLSVSADPSALTGWQKYREKPVVPQTLEAVQFKGTLESALEIDKLLGKLTVDWNEDPRTGGTVDLHIKRFEIRKGDWICRRMVRDGKQWVQACWRETESDFKEDYELVKE